MEAARAAVRKEKDKQRKRLDRLGESLVEWEERIVQLETALEPWGHPKGKPRTQEQIVMALQTCLFFMRQARIDAEEDGSMGLLSLNAAERSTAAVHGMKFDHTKDIRKTPC